MRKTRLFLACFIAACSAVPLASPAAAQETECPPTWVWDYAFAVASPPPPPWSIWDLVTTTDGTITIRGDLAAAAATGYVAHYTEATRTFLTCLERAAVGTVTPYVDCLMARSEAIRTSPDPAGRYVGVGQDLVVRVYYGLAYDEARQIFNCNGIVTIGE